MEVYSKVCQSKKKSETVMIINILYVLIMDESTCLDSEVFLRERISTLKGGKRGKKHLQANILYVLTSSRLCRPNGRTISCRSRVRQTTRANTLHLRSAVCKLSSFHCICSNMFPHSDASCQEAFFRTPGNQPGGVFPPPLKCHVHFSSGRCFREPWHLSAFPPCLRR